MGIEWVGNGWAIVLVVLFFSLSIFVHELGHFLAARMFGLVVDTFSIGLGPALWKRRYGGVVYKIGCLPLGGYVALPQLDPSGMRAVQGDNGAAAGPLPPVAPWKKIVVSVAGAAGNMAFAFLLAWIVYWVGMPAGPAERSAAVGYVDAASRAYEAGLRVGDVVLEVNGRSVASWRDCIQEVALHPEVQLRVRRPDGSLFTLTLPTEPGIVGEASLGGVDGRNLCVVLNTQPGMSAELAGIRAGDTIVRFAGQEVLSRGHLMALVKEYRDRPADVRVRRMQDGRPVTVDLRVTPAYDAAHDQVRIGITFNMAAVDLDTIVRPRPMEQIRGHAGAILRFLGALFTPKQAKAATQQVGGPVAIVVSYWLIVKTSFTLALWFTAFLNVNLAIINLLPFPVLDGGHILFSLWETVARRPVHPRVVNVLVNAFAVLLIGVFVLITVRDTDRFTPAGRLLRKAFAREAATNDAPAAVAAPATPAGTNAP